MDFTAIIATVTTVALGVTLIWTKVDKVLIALKELADVLSIISISLSDKKLTAEEVIAIKKEVGEAIAAFKAVLK